MGLAKQTKEYIRKNDLLQKGDRLMLAVSGGADSMCLAHVMLALRKELGVEIAIAHFDHGLRPESAEDARFVADFAETQGLPCYVGRENIAALGGNLEDTARRERYAFLRARAAQFRADGILLAHHMDDQAETLLLHLLRGSGTAGLAAMSPRENGLIRPLLFAGRSEIMDYVSAHGIDYRQDSSNSDTRFLRNRLRHLLIPELKEYNPNIVQSLCITADICREEDALLEDMAENAFAMLWLEEGGLRREGLEKLPPALRRRVVRKAFCLVGGEKRELDFARTEAVLSLKEEGQTELPGGLKAYRRGELYFAPQMPPLPEYGEEIPLQADGIWHPLAEWGWEYLAQPAGDLPEQGRDAYLLPEAMLASAVWRTRRKGDRLPGREKKLKDLFIDAHIPPVQRCGLPLLTVDGEIRFVPFLYSAAYPKEEKLILIKLRKCDKI